MAKKRLDPIITERDLNILLFLWKYRVSTFQTIRTRFFPEIKDETAYERIRRLRRGGYIQSSYLNGTNNLIWMLDKRGFEYLQERVLPQLVVKSYKPQSAYHDLLAMSALLGDWLTAPPNSVRVVSEAEIRATEIPGLPTVFKDKPEHFPDGMWMFADGSDFKGVALEVEISVKKFARYVEICSFYTSQLFFDHVVWIVVNSAHANLILEASRKYGIPREGVHLFIGQRDFETRLWESRVLNQSMRDVSLAMLLKGRIKQKKRLRHPEPLPETGTASTPRSAGEEQISPFFNFRISLDRFRTYGGREASKIS